MNHRLDRRTLLSSSMAVGAGAALATAGFAPAFAATPGKVIHETPLYQLIHYAPSTDTVPDEAREMPAIARISSVRPAPARPTRPTISRARADRSPRSMPLRRSRNI